MSPGHQLLSTSLVDLDCLGMIGDGLGYEDLQDRTVALTLASGRSIRVLSLPALIETKEQAARPKDLAALPVLRATLEESKRVP